LNEKRKISLDEYLQEVARFCDDEYGNAVRSRFQDVRGTSELAMLVAPTCDELAQLRRAVAIMTPSEKQSADRLSDEQMERIAVDAHVDPATFAIFMNGYALVCKRVSSSATGG
jgi:glycine cleavage system regulatory protein